MIKEILFIGSLIAAPYAAPVTIPAYVAIPAALAVAVPVDRAVNTLTGGTAGKTISGDTARARTAGSEWASFKCDTYAVVSWYDHLYFTQSEFDEFRAIGASDHCARWEYYEANYRWEPFPPITKTYNFNR